MGLALALGDPNEKPYTETMVRALGAVVLVVAVSGTARGEPIRTDSAASTAATESIRPVLASEPSSDEQAFAAALERFTRLRSFTEQLLAKREADAFEQAALRQARVAKLQRELTEREAAMSEREFGDAVALYLKKRKLTQELAAAASRAKASPSP